MKIVIEPRRFIRMLENVLLSPRDEEVKGNIGHFKPDRVEFNALRGDSMGVYAVYSKDFFLKYEADNERIPLSENLLKVVKKSFSKDKEITVLREGDNILIRGKSSYEAPLVDVSIEPIDLQFSIDERLGLVPEGLNPRVQVFLSPNSLPNMSGADFCKFNSDGTNLKVTWNDDVGGYTYDIPTIRAHTLSNGFESRYTASTFNRIVLQFNGSFWLTFHEKADGNHVVVFSGKYRDHILTYMLVVL